MQLCDESNICMQMVVLGCSGARAAKVTMLVKYIVEACIIGYQECIR